MLIAIADRIRTLNLYNSLLANPILVLTNNQLFVNGLPNVADGTATPMWFAHSGNNIVIDQDQNTARMYVMGPQGCEIQQTMLVSTMRGSGLAPGLMGRHRVTVRVNAAAINARLWVTELQNGCSLLILDWGGNHYSMIHIQPSQNNQFNMVGRAFMGLGNYTSRLTGPDLFRSFYKNTWLKQELTTIVNNTGGAAPQRYILVESMYVASRGDVLQILGVRTGNQFAFYKQVMQGNNSQVQQLAWTNWRSYLPYFSY